LLRKSNILLLFVVFFCKKSKDSPIFSFFVFC
jgi:hypothetical protein